MWNKSNSDRNDREVPKFGFKNNIHYMTGSEAEIICGEWETGQFLSQDEEYNIILPIMEVIRCNQHPTGKEL